jgi:preprotein translocase subunit YajC
MTPAWAQTDAGAVPAAPGGPLVFLVQALPFILVMVIFYVMLVRPQQKKQAETRRMIESLKKGDRVVTQSGIHGTVVGIDGDIAVLRVAENVKMEFTKSAIIGVAPVSRGGAEKPERERGERERAERGEKR